MVPVHLLLPHAEKGPGQRHQQPCVGRQRLENRLDGGRVHLLREYQVRRCSSRVAPPPTSAARLPPRARPYIPCTLLILCIVYLVKKGINQRAGDLAESPNRTACLCRATGIIPFGSTGHEAMMMLIGTSSPASDRLVSCGSLVYPMAHSPVCVTVMRKTKICLSAYKMDV